MLTSLSTKQKSPGHCAFAEAPREVLTASGQSKTLEALRVRGEGGSLEEQLPGPSGLFNLVAPPKVKCARGLECRPSAEVDG